VLLDDVDISASSDQLLTNLRLTSPSEHHTATSFHLSFLDNLVREAADITAIVASHYRTITDEASKDVQLLRNHVGKMQVLLDNVSHDVLQAMKTRGLSPIQHRKRFNRESEDSQATVVVSVSEPKSIPLASVQILDPSEKSDHLPPPSVESIKATSFGEVVEQFVRLQKEEEDRIGKGELAKSLKKSQSGTMRIKEWMKRKLLSVDAVDGPTPPAKEWLTQRPVLAAIPEQQTEAVAIMVVPPSPPAVDIDLSADAWIDGLLRTSYATLQAASRDLDRITECIAAVRLPLHRCHPLVLTAVRRQNILSPLLIDAQHGQSELSTERSRYVQLSSPHSFLTNSTSRNERLPSPSFVWHPLPRRVTISSCGLACSPPNPVSHRCRLCTRPAHHVCRLPLPSRRKKTMTPGSFAVFYCAKLFPEPAGLRKNSKKESRGSVS
jgi:hypothetical protein